MVIMIEVKKQSTVPGGLGGYSRGILKLNKKKTVYVQVKKVVHQIRPAAQVQKENSLTVEEQKQDTTVFTQQFQEQEEVLHKFKSEVTQTTIE